MSWTQEKAKETLIQVQEKAAYDAAFREKLKTNPNTAIEEISGIQVPNLFSINIVDADEIDLTIVLPKTKTDELSDADLEAVAGGKSAGEIFGDVVDDTMGVAARAID